VTAARDWLGFTRVSLEPLDASCAAVPTSSKQSTPEATFAAIRGEPPCTSGGPAESTAVVSRLFRQLQEWHMRHALRRPQLEEES
jgi:hypothetical protein